MRKDLDIFFLLHYTMKMTKMTNDKMPKKYYCETCDFICSKESNWNSHLITAKHEIRKNTNMALPENATKHECICGKTYKHASSLWNHKQKCDYDGNIVLDSSKQTNTVIPIDHTSLTEKIIELVMSKNQQFITELVSNITSSNKDVMEKMMEIMPQVGNQSNNNNNINSNNNFNIQMFLNNHCKNAMNLKDFIDTLPITAETYDNTIENGLTKTITSMITNGLSQLDILDRPIHCTDATRKTIYVKEEDIWEKDTELVKILLGIKTLARKQRNMIHEWKDVNKGWDKDETIQMKFTNLICNSMTDIENDEKEVSKIIRLISKQVYLTKDTRDEYIQLK